MSFDNYAQEWDTEVRISRAEKIANEIRKQTRDRKGGAAMEFGCGTGLVSFNLTDHFKEITLMDSSQGMIDVLGGKIDLLKVGNLFPKWVDITQGDGIVGQYEVIYHSMVLHHIQELEAVNRDFYDALEDGGCLCFVDLDEDGGLFHSNYPEFEGHQGFNQENLRGLLQKIGFKEVRSYTFYHDEKQINGRGVPYSLFIMHALK